MRLNPPLESSIEREVVKRPRAVAKSVALKSPTQLSGQELVGQLGRVETFGGVLAAILVCHMAVDALAALAPSSLGLIEARFGLTAKQSAWLLGLGSLTSGLAQPICAILSDRLATRQLGVLGAAIGAIGIAAIGFCDGFVSLAICFALGMIGIGMFHPVAASTIGQLRSDRRSTAVSLFFVAGMAGGVLGALCWPRVLAVESGFRFVPWIAAPAAGLALWLRHGYAHVAPLRRRADVDWEELAERTQWKDVGVLYVAAALRFSVSTSLTYLFVRWVQSGFNAANPGWSESQVAIASAPLVGNLNAWTLAGMAVGGLGAGLLVRSGSEKRPMILAPLAFAPLVALFPHAPLAAAYLLACCAGIGFAAMIPITIALAQQLMPQRPNLASSLMMGGAWAVAMLGPRCAEFGVERWGLPTTFALTALTLALSGVVCLGLGNPDKPASEK